MKPYLSIDIETTGLDIICEVLQIAAIYDNGENNIGDMKMIDIKIKHKQFIAEPQAVLMNHDLIKEIEASDTGDGSDFCTPENAAVRFTNFLSGLFTYADKLTIAGKNVATFDIPRLERFVNMHHSYAKWSDYNWNHRSLDVGSLYYPDFGEIVSLSKINKLLGRKAVSHNAMEDATDVIYAVRAKMGGWWR